MTHNSLFKNLTEHAASLTKQSIGKLNCKLGFKSSSKLNTCKFNTCKAWSCSIWDDNQFVCWCFCAHEQTKAMHRIEQPCLISNGFKLTTSLPFRHTLILSMMKSWLYLDMHKNVLRVREQFPRVSTNHHKPMQKSSSRTVQYCSLVARVQDRIFACGHARTGTVSAHCATIYTAHKLWLCSTLGLNPCFLFFSPVDLAFLVPWLQASSPKHFHVLWILVAVVLTSLQSPKVLLVLLQMKDKQQN